MYAIYARAPDDEPAEVQGQITRCRARAMSNGVRIVAGSIYTDGGEDESGAARVGLKSLIEGVEDGSIRTVYVDTLRCLGSPDLVRSLIDRWQRKGVAIVTASHGRVSRHR